MHWMAAGTTAREHGGRPSWRSARLSVTATAMWTESSSWDSPGFYRDSWVLAAVMLALLGSLIACRTCEPRVSRLGVSFRIPGWHNDRSEWSSWHERGAEPIVEGCVGSR